MRTPRLLLFGALGLAGCSSSSPSDSTGGAGSTATSGGATGGNSATGGSTARCDPGPGYADDSPAQRVDAVSAQLVDLDELPLSFEFVQVCGTDICIQGKATESGGVVVEPRQFMTKPAFKFGEGKVTPRFARLLPKDFSVDFGIVHSVRLPELGGGVALVAGSDASSGGLTLSPEQNSQIKIDKLTFGEADEQKLRAVRVPLDRASDLIDPEPGIELLYAATPTSTQFCPPVRLQVDNTEGWAPGTEVEVLLHGVEIDEEWAPYGGWAKVSDARVSDDGTRIETTEPGVPLLGVLGFRRK